MLILALDSTAVAASVALTEDDCPLAAFQLENGHTHSGTLLPMVKSIMDVTGHTVDDIDLFACSIGPGSFTGVRIGAATIKGLAYGKGKNVLGVSTLEALAENLMPQNALICPVMNARREQVYTALFRGENGVLTRLTPDTALSVEDLEALLEERGEPFYLSGDGAELTRAALRRLVSLPTPALLRAQNAVSVARVAYRAAKKGAVGTDADLKPLYLRIPQAERERLAKTQQ